MLATEEHAVGRLTQFHEEKSLRVSVLSAAVRSDMWYSSMHAVTYHKDSTTGESQRKMQDLLV